MTRRLQDRNSMAKIKNAMAASKQSTGEGPGRKGQALAVFVKVTPP